MTDQPVAPPPLTPEQQAALEADIRALGVPPAPPPAPPTEPEAAAESHGGTISN